MVAPQLGSPAAWDGSTWCRGLLDHALEKGALRAHANARAVRALDIQAERRANLKRVVSFEEYASDPTGTLGRLLTELPYKDGQRPDVNALARAASHAGRDAGTIASEAGGRAGAGRGGGGWGLPLLLACRGLACCIHAVAVAVAVLVATLPPRTPF